MRPDDLTSLDDLARAVESDARFGGYEVAALAPGLCELRLGEHALALLDARVFGDDKRLEEELRKARAGACRLVLLGTEDELAAAARHADAAEVSLHVLPMSRARAALVLPAELDLLVHRRRSRERGQKADRYAWENGELLAISRALSSERDVVRLLGLILEKSRFLVGADAGSVYIVEGDERAHLRFVVSQNDSMAVDFREFTLPVDERSVVGKVAQRRAQVNVADLRRLDEPGGNPFGVQHNRAVDEKSGYRTRSMLAFPLVNQRDEVIGVIQLINRKRHGKARLRTPEDFDAQVIPFDARDEELCETLAGQAGVCLENALLDREIQQLFEGLVRASVTAIESRDPTTSGHSQRVATLTCELAKTIDRVETGPYAPLRFTPDELKQLEYAGLLHDFGKVGVRESVLVKARKLYEHERERVVARFDYVRKSLEADCLRRRLEQAARGRLPPSSHELFELDDEGRAELSRLDEMLELVLAANEPSVVAEGSFERLLHIAERRFRDARGDSRPYLTPDELDSLRIARGSLTKAERAEIESHVLHTYNFLATIPWGRRLRKIPIIASTHHEKLDGTGYPWGLSAEEISVEARMMAIADIFDALTASDRPYKKAVPTARAIAILDEEARAGKCDGELLRVFVEARVWERLPA